MSTYAVFGMARHRAVEIVRKATDPKMVGEGADRHAETPTEYEARVQAEADKIMDSKRCVQLSEKFDAPCFAQEFKALAERSGARRLHIKSYSQTGDFHPKTRKPVYAWSDLNK